MELGEAVIVAGIGSRKGVSASEVVAAVEAALKEHGLERSALSMLATAKMKQDEAGIVAASAAPGTKKGVLDGIFGGRPISGYAVCDRKGHRLVALVKLLQCLQLACGQPVNETPVAVIGRLVAATYSHVRVGRLTRGWERAHGRECR